MKKSSSLQKFRLAVQIVFVAFVLYVSIGHYIVENNPGVELFGVASLHTLCPYGGVVNLYTFFTTGNYVSKLHQSVFIMLFALFALLLFTGASFCGWICPLGSVQEWVGKLGKKIFKDKYNRVPVKVDRVLRYLKYIVLAIIIIQTARTSKLVFEPYDPYYNLFNIWTDEIAITGYISVLLVLGLSLFVERPFCRYACPLGAINGLFNSFSFLTIKRKKDTCINCKLCDRACPVGIVVSEKNAINSPQCIRCMKCVEACPVNDSSKLTLQIRPILTKPEKSKKTVSLWNYAFIALALFLGVILIANVSGNFNTEKIRTYNSINDIRGSSTLQEIIDNYPVSKEELYRAFNIPRNIVTTAKLKDLSELMGFDEELEIVSPEGIRSFVEYIDMNVSDFLAEYGKTINDFDELKSIEGIENMSVRDIIKKTKPGFIAYVISGYLPGEVSENQEANISNSTVEKEEHDTSEFIIRGKTTLKEIKENIDDYNAFLKEFGISEKESSLMELKDIVQKYNLSMSDIKDYIELHTK
ncbi:4Fe-4S ferredoxin [Marinitoga sp. 1137]|uniref:4Fe-4S binding protein n=1 Tax=Marinitoga sp. 1137 TaxID=1545835 RepID=UPI0009508FBA|nr:4Fe-4S binding protein [Marinitoga sp. 1137]APT76136.1 4Fe-4S ferredoxin [Marinitoga sp. 1137]